MAYVDYMDLAVCCSRYAVTYLFTYSSIFSKSHRLPQFYPSFLIFGLNMHNSIVEKPEYFASIFFLFDTEMAQMI